MSFQPSNPLSSFLLPLFPFTPVLKSVLRPAFQHSIQPSNTSFQPSSPSSSFLLLISHVFRPSSPPSSLIARASRTPHSCQPVSSLAAYQPSIQPVCMPYSLSSLYVFVSFSRFPASVLDGFADFFYFPPSVLYVFCSLLPPSSPGSFPFSQSTCRPSLQSALQSGSPIFLVFALLFARQFFPERFSTPS